MKSRWSTSVSLLAVLVLGFSATAFAGATPGGGKGGVAPGQWVIMTYVPDNNFTVPVPLSVSPVKGGGVSFDFLPTPDRAMLITELKQSKKSVGSLTGKTLSAHIAINATPGAEFNYCGPNCDGTDPGGFVRLYIQGVNPALVGCEPGWHPERPDCEAQYWWSNPIAVDLDDLALLGSDGNVLEVPLDPEFWSDRDGHMGTDATPVDHTAAFEAAVTNATKIALSFGGGNNFAFGAGVTDPATATFILYRLEIK